MNITIHDNPNGTKSATYLKTSIILDKNIIRTYRRDATTQVPLSQREEKYNSRPVAEIAFNAKIQDWIKARGKKRGKKPSNK